MHCI
jgi:ATP-dependent RNA helicase DDX54/DBP10